MKDILKDIDETFGMISRIPVTGDSVDIMAVARTKLRNVYTKLRNLDIVESNDSLEKNEEN